MAERRPDREGTIYRVYTWDSEGPGGGFDWHKTYYCLYRFDGLKRTWTPVDVDGHSRHRSYEPLIAWADAHAVELASEPASRRRRTILVDAARLAIYESCLGKPEMSVKIEGCEPDSAVEVFVADFGNDYTAEVKLYSGYNGYGLHVDVVLLRAGSVVGFCPSTKTLRNPWVLEDGCDHEFVVALEPQSDYEGAYATTVSIGRELAFTFELQFRTGDGSPPPKEFVDEAQAIGRREPREKLSGAGLATRGGIHLLRFHAASREVCEARERDGRALLEKYGYAVSGGNRSCRVEESGMALVVAP